MALTSKCSLDQWHPKELNMFYVQYSSTSTVWVKVMFLSNFNCLQRKWNKSDWLLTAGAQTVKLWFFSFLSKQPWLPQKMQGLFLRVQQNSQTLKVEVYQHSTHHNYLRNRPPNAHHAGCSFYMGGVIQRLSIFLSSPFWNVIAKACPPCHCNSIGINNLMNSLVVVTRLACVPLYNSPKNPQKVYSKGGIMQR
jgi:hypothetical protein